jgi:hypothetical protein
VRLPFFGKRAACSDRWPLPTPLVNWSRQDAWTIGDAMAGCLICGATGSGKSSGSGRTLARAMLNAGFGGLVLTAKKDERAKWESYCKQAGRFDDLLVFGATENLRFNFLDYELSRAGEGAGLTANIVGLFSTVMEIAERRGGSGGGRESESYWLRAALQLISNLVDLQSMATGRVSVPELYRLVTSAPTSFEQLRSDAWRKESFCFRCLQQADAKSKNAIQLHDFDVVTAYFCSEFPGLSDKTRSVIVSTFTSMIDVLNRGIPRFLFCGDTNVTPEVIEDGKIILIDLPVKEFAEVGLFSQVLWKHAFQRAVERRDVTRNPRPAFLWADEAQHFLTSYDMTFAATCRSSRVANVLLTQNISNFDAALGGTPKGKAEAASLFANLTTKIFHANGDPVTNEWASSLIGKSLQYFANGGSSRQEEHWPAAAMGMARPTQTNAGFSESYEFEVQPSAFLPLRTGGRVNGGMVDAIVTQSGRRFRANGKTWLPVAFQQQI